MSPPSIWKLPPKHSHFAETRSISLMQAAGTRIPLIERKGYLRSPIRNEVEHSAKKILAECSTRWPSAQYFRSIIQPNYQVMRGLFPSFSSENIYFETKKVPLESELSSELFRWMEALRRRSSLLSVAR